MQRTGCESDLEISKPLATIRQGLLYPEIILAAGVSVILNKQLRT